VDDDDQPATTPTMLAISRSSRYVSAVCAALLPLADVLADELERTPGASNHGTLSERLEGANKAVVVPFTGVVRGTTATITAVLTNVVVWFDSDEHSKFTAPFAVVVVDPSVIHWGPAHMQRSQLSIARREGLKKSAARHQPKPRPRPTPPPGWRPLPAAARGAGIAESTLYCLTRKGLVPSRQLPGNQARLIDVEALERWLDERQPPAGWKQPS